MSYGTLLQLTIYLGMRNSADVIIHVDLEKALAAGIKFYLSANGVVLTEGDETGFLAPEYFSRVETRDGKALPGWEGKANEPSVVESSQSAKAAVPPTESVKVDDMITSEA
jgi:2'-phosphotransferase